MLKLKNEYSIKELEKFGFVDGVYTKKNGDKYLYSIYFTNKNRNLFVEFYDSCRVFSELQTLIFNLCEKGFLEKVQTPKNKSKKRKKSPKKT